jgi:hypothetical protein
VANGTFVADIAYEVEPYRKKYHRIGAILYFRSHECKIKLIDFPPTDRYIIGKFKPSEKVPEAPYLEGDVFIKDAAEVDRKVGHIHSEQNEVGDTMYWLKFDVCVVIERAHAIWLKVKLED